MNRYLAILLHVLLSTPLVRAVSRRSNLRHPLNASVEGDVALQFTDTSVNKVLLYWAAQADDHVMQLITKNINHLKGGGLNCDVMLLHYDQNKTTWMQRDEAWYNSTITWGLDLKGWKLLSFYKIYHDKLADGLNLNNYDWVWMLDEDMDLTAVQPSSFFADVKATDALIVGPAFVQRSFEDPSALEKPWYALNHPQAAYRFRYVPFVEIIMPLVRAPMLDVLFSSGVKPITEKSDWGLDRVWCHFLARKFAWGNTHTCAIVDHSGIVHANFRSTRAKCDPSGEEDCNETAETAKPESAIREGSKAMKIFRKRMVDDFVPNGYAEETSFAGFAKVRLAAA